MTRRKGFAFRVSNKDRPHDPGGGVDCVRGPIPRKDQITNLPLNTGKTRGNRPAWTPLESTGQTESNIFSQSKESAVEEAARSEIGLLKPNRCQKTDMSDRGSNVDTRLSIPFRRDDCDTQMLTGHHSVMTEDMEVEPGPIRMYPVKMDGAPIYGENVPLRPMTFLDVPATRLTGGFLKLAEEARHSEGVDDQPPGMNLVHSQHSGWTGRTLIVEIEDSFPGSGSEDSRGSRTSTEVIPNCKIEKPVIRLGPVGQDIRGLGYTNVMAKPDPVGPYEDGDLSVSRMTDGPAGLVRIRRPEGPYKDREISVSPVNDGPAGLVRTRRPVGSYEDRDISVSPVTDGPAGLVRTRRPVGSDEDRDVSVPPVTDGPAGLVRTRRPVGQYEDRDISVSPVDGGDLPTLMLEETVGRLQRDLEELQVENQLLKTPRTVRPVPLARQAALTTTKVPWFDGSTSWEQYLLVFEAIVLSNGWGDTTAALQLLSHLQGDALSVALLTPMPLQATRKELTEALSSHYGSPGRLANYRREFDKTVRKMGRILLTLRLNWKRWP